MKTKLLITKAAVLVCSLILITSPQVLSGGEKTSTTDRKEMAQFLEATGLSTNELDSFNQQLQAANTAGEKELLESLRKEFPANLVVRWVDVKGIDKQGKNALGLGWLMNYARAYPMDHLIGRNVHSYLEHELRSKQFGELCKRDMNAALRFIGEKNDETDPTLFLAIISGTIVSHATTVPEDKNTEQIDSSQVFAGSTEDCWRSMLQARNPIIHAVALRFADKYKSEDLLPEAINRALQSDWLSLHYIALDKALLLSSVGLKPALKKYLSADLDGVPEPVVKELKAKAQNILDNQ